MDHLLKRVLVVDDNADARNTIRALLELEGFVVYVAANGREAIEIHRRNQIDAVLTDIFMPEKDGIETIHELRAKDPSVQIAVMTGSHQERVERFQVVAGELGVSKFLRKPVPPDVLIATVKEMACAPHGEPTSSSLFETFRKPDT